MSISKSIKKFFLGNSSSKMVDKKENIETYDSKWNSLSNISKVIKIQKDVDEPISCMFDVNEDNKVQVLAKDRRWNKNSKYVAGSCFVIGGSGSGKSSQIAKPTILNSNCSMFVSDPKGSELKRDTEGKLKAKGYKVYYFNAMDFESDNWNLFQEFLDEPDINKQNVILSQICEILIPETPNTKGSFLNTQRQWLKGFCLLCYEELGELSLQNIINLISQPQKDIYDFLCERGKDKRYFSYLSNFSMDEQATIYYATFVSSVNKFNVQSVLDKTNCSTINFDDFIKQKTVIYVKMNRINPESFENDIAKILMQSLYKKLSAHAETTKNGCLDIPFIFLCDEFANVGKINFAPKIFSLSRSENISIICFIQGISQLKEIYGENQLQEMFDSTMCFFILKLTDTKFAQQLSSLFGRKLERIESKSKGAGGENKSESVTTQQQLIEQIRYEDLINKSRNEVIIIPEGVLAIKLKFQFMHERK